MKRWMIWTLVMLMAMFGAVPAMARYEAKKAADCSTYARNRAESEASAGSGALRGAVKGAVGGAVFGAIVGGKKGFKRGAALGGGVGAIGGGMKGSRSRKERYQFYYDACMRGERF